MTSIPRKRVQDLKPGDVVLLDLPVRVRVVSVEYAGLASASGLMRLVYTDGACYSPNGHQLIGCLVEVEALSTS